MYDINDGSVSEQDCVADTQKIWVNMPMVPENLQRGDESEMASSY